MCIVKVIKISRNLFVVLFLSWLWFSSVPEKTENSVKGVQIFSPIRSRGGGIVSDSNQTQVSSIKVPEASKPRQDTSIPRSTSLPGENLTGENIRYSPGWNGGVKPNTVLTKKQFFRETSKFHFLDSDERINYQKKQAKLYKSGLTKVLAGKRAKNGK